MPTESRLQAALSRHLGSEVIPFERILQLFWPILFDTTMVAVMSMLSSSMVSSSGEAAVAAVNMVETVNLFVTNFYVAIATGSTVVVAQYIGHKNHAAAGQAIVQAVLSAAALAIFVAACLIGFSQQVIGLLFGGAEPLVLGYGRTYLICCALSYPLYSVFQVSLGALRGSGDTKASMMLSVMLNAVFLAGNFLLINICKLGVLGSGISLIFCRALLGVLSLGYLLKRRPDLQIKLKAFFRLDMAMQKRILYIGLPTALEQVFFHGGKIITQTFIVALGTVSMTANAVANSIFNLTISPGNAINVLVVTVVGYCIGAGRPDEAKRLLVSLSIATSVIHVLLGLLLLPLLPVLIIPYHVSPETGVHIMNCLKIVLLMIPLSWPYASLFPSGFRAAGDARFTSLTALVTMWVVRVTLGYLLAINFNLGIEGVWLAMCIEWVVKSLVFLWRLRGDRWCRHKLIEN
ncbi:MAG: MATE family efflux transporter [Oscillospiraceae bacterium]|nr:MATE family efflux transporter [Oscillospiraceae bacterium]